MKLVLVFTLLLFFINGCMSDDIPLNHYVFNSDNNLKMAHEDSNLMVVVVLKPEDLVAARNDGGIIMKKPILEYFDDKLHIEFKIDIRNFDNSDEEAQLVREFGKNLEQNVYIEYSKGKAFPAFSYQEKSALNKITYTYMTIFENMDLKLLHAHNETICFTIVNHPFSKNRKIQLCFDLKDIKV